MGPLTCMLRYGSEEEQTHACRLLAILAQATPTHGILQEQQVRGTWPWPRPWGGVWWGLLKGVHTQTSGLGLPVCM